MGGEMTAAAPDAPRIVMLSLSSDLAADPRDGLNEAQQRQVAYARSCRSVRIVVKTPPDAAYLPRQIADHVFVHPTRSRNRPHAAWRMFRTADELIRSGGADLLVTQDPFLTGAIGAVLAAKHRLPLCVHYVCDFVDNPFWLAERPIHSLLNRVGKYVLRRATAVRVDSPDQPARLRQLGVPPAAVHYIPFLQVGLERFVDPPRDERMRSDLLGSAGAALVLFVGRLEPQKDLATLVEVIAQVVRSKPATRFVIVGDGAERRSLERTLADRGLREVTRLVGWIDFADLPRYFGVSDVFLLTSRYESAARVLVLARCAGLPIVATSVSGTAELMAGDQGCATAPVGDADGLAALLAARLDRMDAARRAALACRERLLHEFSAPLILERVQQMYAAAVGAVSSGQRL
jgi:glycosyltransferase involved in cell wall biosynthesis